MLFTVCKIRDVLPHSVSTCNHPLELGLSRDLELFRQDTVDALIMNNMFHQAGPIVRQKLDMQYRYHDALNFSIAHSISQLAYVLEELTELDESEKLRRKSYKIHQSILGAEFDELGLALSMDNLGDVLEETGIRYMVVLIMYISLSLL